MLDFIRRRRAAGTEQRLERSPGITIQREAKAHARRELDDGALAVSLKQALISVDSSEIQREISGWHPRNNYFDDRAYRLLVGAATGTVPEIPAEKRQQFDRELWLGSLPLSQAFREIAALDPVLKRLEAALRESPLPRRKVGRFILNEQEASPVIGAGLSSFDFQVAYAYLVRVSLGKSVASPYLENPMFLGGLHGTLGAGT